MVSRATAASRTAETVSHSTSTVYAHRSNDQHSSLLQRLKRRQVTPRKVFTYIAAAVLLSFAQPEVLSFTIGALIVLAGLGLRVWSFGHLEKNQRLITTGPYAHSRNPAYLGSALILAGMIAAAGNADNSGGLAIWVVGLLGMAIFFLAYLPRKYRREYKRLAGLFPGEYERHAEHVPHFWPQLSPWRNGDSRRFSWACVRANHEIVWPAVCVVALSLMWVG